MEKKNNNKKLVSNRLEKILVELENENVLVWVNELAYLYRDAWEDLDVDGRCAVIRHLESLSSVANAVFREKLRVLIDLSKEQFDADDRMVEGLESILEE